MKILDTFVSLNGTTTQSEIIKNSLSFCAKKVSALICVLGFLVVNISFLYSQTGEVQVQSPLRVFGPVYIQPQGDIGMGIFQPVSSPGTIVDTDGNGLPDAWEMQYFGHLGNNPTADTDGDGLTNLQEYQQGSNPAVPNTTPPPPALPPMNGMLAWYYGSEAYTDAGMQAKCTQGGTDACYTLKDLSGNGRNLVQATATKQPIYQAGQKPSVTFDGVDDELLLSSFTQSQPISIFMVAKAKSYSGSNQDWISLNSTGNGLRVKTDATNITVMSGAATGAAVPRPAQATYYMIATQLNMTASSIKLGKNTTVTGPGSTLGSTFISLGSGNGQRFSNIDVCELIIYAGALNPDSGDGLWVRQYLDAKYNFGIYSKIKVPPLDNIIARYDASKAYQDDARTIPCVNDGDLISTIEDLSGNNRHLTLTTPSNPKPVLHADATNQKPAWKRIAGTSDLHNLSPIPGPFIIYVLMNVQVDSSIWANTNPGNPNDYQPRVDFDPVYYYVPFNTPWQPGPQGIVMNKWVLSVYQMSNNGYFKIDLNPALNHSWAPSLDGFATGVTGDTAEILIYQGQHDPTAGIGLDVYRYFNSKYNLNLPVP